MSRFRRAELSPVVDRALQSYELDSSRDKPLSEDEYRNMNERLMQLGNHRIEILRTIQTDYHEHYGLLAVTKLWARMQEDASTLVLSSILHMCKRYEADQQFVTAVARLLSLI